MILYSVSLITTTTCYMKQTRWEQEHIATKGLAHNAMTSLYQAYIMSREKSGEYIIPLMSKKNTEKLEI